MTISAVVLAKNQVDNIVRCLSSLKWCDEVIVIDDNSSDQTPAIAKKMGAKVFTKSLNGDFASQHNFGLEKASNNWVLFIDADEQVSLKLADEIKMEILNSKMPGYKIRRLDNFWNQWLYHGEAGQQKFVRLGQKDSGRWERLIHEYWNIPGSLGTLKNPLLHYPHPTVHEFLKSINRWTDFDCIELEKEGKHFSFFRLISNPLGKFFLNYFLKLGFLDGWPGFVYAFMMSLYSLIVRVKMFSNDLS